LIFVILHYFIHPMELDFAKMPEQLIPAVVQDALTGQVLMLGYLNAEAWAQTQSQGRVTFYSRSKQRLWTKGETSGHYLRLVSAHPDCDADALLLLVEPAGPTCHRGTTSCFEQVGVGSLPTAIKAAAESAIPAGVVAADSEPVANWSASSPVPLVSFLTELDQLIAQRQLDPAQAPGSYTVRLLEKGLARIAQKVGEEAVETVIEALLGRREGLVGEAADLVYHLLLLLRVSGSSLTEVLLVLRQRHQLIAAGNRRPLPE